MLGIFVWSCAYCFQSSCSFVVLFCRLSGLQQWEGKEAVPEGDRLPPWRTPGRRVSLWGWLVTWLPRGMWVELHQRLIEYLASTHTVGVFTVYLHGDVFVVMYMHCRSCRHCKCIYVCMDCRHCHSSCTGSLRPSWWIVWGTPAGPWVWSSTLPSLADTTTLRYDNAPSCIDSVVESLPSHTDTMTLRYTNTRAPSCTETMTVIC